MKFYKPALIILLLCFIFPLMTIADPLEDAKTAIRNKDYSKANELLLPLAEENNAEAQTLLGALYINGQGVKADFSKGLSLIMKAALQGNKDARSKAFMLHLELANQGDAAAMYNVGYMCLNRWGGGDYGNDVCLKWLENAAKLGHEKSARILEKIYTEGMFGITPNEEKAASWKKLLAAYAAGIDGKWKGSADTGMGRPPMEYTFEFVTDGDTLKGTSIGFGIKTPISDGKFDGTNISFTVKTNFGGMNSTTDYTGTFYGDRLKLTSKTEMEQKKGFPGSKMLEDSRTGDKGFPPVTFFVTRVE